MVCLQFSPNLVPQLGCSRVGLTAPLCIDCVSGLSYLAHAPIIYMECLATHPWHVVLCVTIYANPRMAWLDLFCSSHQIWLHRLGALRLGWTGSRCIDCFPCLSDIVHAPTKGMGDNISMAYCSSCNNIHQPEDGMVVLQFSPNLIPQLGCFMGLDGQHHYVLILSHACYTSIMHP